MNSEQKGLFLYQDTTRNILGAAFEVHGQLGPGFLESVYEEALCQEFRERGIAFERQKEFQIHYKHVVLPQRYRADLLVEGKIIVENKAVAKLTGVDEAQLLNYLKATGLRIGLPLNFGARRLEYTRRIL
jgi:GxxExxY protein